MPRYFPGGSKECIDEGYPVYASINGRPENHAIVIDGYDDNGFMHYNFGWGGDCNGYYVPGKPIYYPAGSWTQYTNTYVTALMIPGPLLPTAVVAQDSLALVDFYNSINRDLYDSYSNKITWDLSQPVSTWKGVSCWKGRVHLIDIYTDLGFAGPGERIEVHIPESFGNLTELRELKIRIGYPLYRTKEG
jgi:hypothetical protein